MKLVINIPCFNEEKTLPLVLSEIPKKIEGINEIITQVIDDGSSDKTVKIAKEFGCEIVKHKYNQGLGIALKSGIDNALRKGADIMVNIDADNQYPAKYIPELVQPIVNNNSDVVIGDRQIWKINHFSFIKKVLQWFGSFVIRKITKTDVSDVVSGFRAFSRESLLRINLITRFSYVIDTIMQCSKKKLKIDTIKINVNNPTRKSRLSKNIFQYLRRSISDIIKIYTIYEPFSTFMWLSIFFFIPALIIVIRFLIFYFSGNGTGHIQSLIAAAILTIVSVLLFVLGILGDLLKKNRELIEEQLYYKKTEIYKK